ncbi:hypothetical protein B0H13DRAFT_2556879, partial [Mycena leptocephala]
HAHTHTGAGWASRWSRVWFWTWLTSDLLPSTMGATRDWSAPDQTDHTGDETGLELECTGDALLELECLAYTTSGSSLPTRTGDKREEKWAKASEMQMDAEMGYRDGLLGYGERCGDARRQGGVAGGDHRCTSPPRACAHAPRALERHARVHEGKDVWDIWCAAEGGSRVEDQLHLPAFLRALRSFAPYVIHLIDPIWLGVQVVIALQILFPSTPIVTSHHMNLPTYAGIFGYAYFHHRTRQFHAYLHSFARYTLVPSPSTARLLREKGWGNLRVMGRGVDGRVFSGRAWGMGSFEPFLPSFLPSLYTSLPLHPRLIPHPILLSSPIHRSPALRTAWGVSSPADVVSEAGEESGVGGVGGLRGSMFGVDAEDGAEDA